MRLLLVCNSTKSVYIRYKRQLLDFFFSGRENKEHTHPTVWLERLTRHCIREEGSNTRVLNTAHSFPLSARPQLGTLLFRHFQQCSKTPPIQPPQRPIEGRLSLLPDLHQKHILIPFPTCGILFCFVFALFSSLEDSFLPQPYFQVLILEVFTKTKREGPQTRMFKIPYGL